MFFCEALQASRSFIAAASIRCASIAQGQRKSSQAIMSLPAVTKVLRPPHPPHLHCEGLQATISITQPDQSVVIATQASARASLFWDKATNVGKNGSIPME
jgi:hypothetical protein